MKPRMRYHKAGIRPMTFDSSAPATGSWEFGTLAGVLRMLADDVEVEVMAREKEMGGGQ